MKKIKKLIIIIIVIIIVISLILLFTLREISKMEKKVEENQSISNTFSKKFIQVSDYNIYFTIKNILNNYLLYAKRINGDVYIDYNNLTEAKEEIEKDMKDNGINGIKNILDPLYLSELSITDDDIIKEQQKYTVNGKYEEDVEYILNLNNVFTFNKTESMTIALVYATLNEKDFNVLLKIDLKNNLYSIFWNDYIEKNNYNENMECNNITIDNTELIKNNYNTFKYVNATMDYIVTQYFGDYRNLMKKSPKGAYEKLNLEYRDKRFNGYEDFKKSLEKKNELNIKIDKYMLNNFENYNQYICIDQYGNYYIFTEKGIMDYEVILDTYTIDLPQFLEKYEEGNEQVKVGMNIEKFISAINAKDYRYAYNCLADSFKNNYYQTQESFEDYVKNNFFENNKIEYIQFSKEGNNYVYDIKILNTQGEEEKQATIIMQLQEGTEFVMSFSIE